MAPEGLHNSEERQLWYYRHVIKELRKGKFNSLSERMGITPENFSALKDERKNEIIKRFINPERLASIQVIIEEFFNSSHFIQAREQLFENSYTNSTMIATYRIQMLIDSAFRKYMIEHPSTPFMHAVRVLENNQKIFGLEFAKKRNYVESILAGFATADYFNTIIYNLLKEQILGFGHITQEEVLNIKKAVRNTFHTLGTLFGSFSIYNHRKSLEMVSKIGRNSFNPEFFEGDIKQGQRLKLNAAKLKEIVELMNNSGSSDTARFRCPAIVSKGDDSPLKKFALLYADRLLCDLNLISREDVVRLSN